MLERLHKVLARAGVAALRPAEDMIMQGRVSVNGRVVRELGARVDPHSDVIAVDGQLIELPKPSDTHRYVAVYKPIGVVSTARDTHDRPTVVGLVPTDARLFPVGRLDLESEGLLLLTDDGNLAYRLTHPRFEVEKEYRVLLDRPPSVEDLRRWRDGVELDGELTVPAWVEVQERVSNGVWVRIVMREGRKRQIREIAKLLGYDVRRLIRVREGTLGLGDLAPGQWRELAPDEVEALRVHVRHVPGPPADEQESRVPTRTPSDEDQPGEADVRRPRRIPPRPGFGARGPTRRAYAASDASEAAPAEAQNEPAPGRHMDGPAQRGASDERPRRPATGERERATYGESGPPRRSGGDQARRDDRGSAQPSQRRDGPQRGPGRQSDQRAPYGRQAEGQRGPNNRRDQDQRGSAGNRDQQRGPYGRRDEGQRGPSGYRDDRQSRSYGNRNTDPANSRGPGGQRSRSSLDPRQGRPSDGGRSRSSLDPRSGRPSDGGRSRSSLDPRSGRPSDGGRSRSSLDPRSGRPSDGGRSRSSLDPRSSSGQGRDRPQYGRSGPGSRSGSGQPGGGSRPGGIRDGIGPSRSNTRGPARPGQRDDRYSGGQRDNRYGSRSSGGSRSGGAGNNATRRPGYDPNRRPDYDPNRRPGPPRSNSSGPPQSSSGGRGSTDGARRSPGPRPSRKPREEENE